MCINPVVIHIGADMRTNIDIDDSLMAEAMKLTGATSKKATVEKALRRLIRGHEQLRALEEIWGTGWEGDLDEMRGGWGFEEDK
jgi:Arc/MetJ family transcription regulator